MKEESLDKPEVFLNYLHERNSGGLIVFGNRNLSSRNVAKVPAHALSKIVRQAAHLPDIFFSITNYSGLPLILNFNQTRSVFVSIPISNKNIAEFTQDLYRYMSTLDIPPPNVIHTDGEQATLLWLLSTPILKHDVYKFCIYQLILFNLFREIGASPTTLNITTLIRCIGTKNTINDCFARTVYFKPETIRQERMELALLKNFNANEYKKLEKHAEMLYEIQMLWHHQTLSLPLRPDLYNDWIIFHGAELCYFCDELQLKKELIAIAESLEGLRWNKISDKYTQLIGCINETARQGIIDINGCAVHTNDPSWKAFIIKRLDITDKETQQLGLNQLSTNETLMRQRIQNIPMTALESYGYDYSKPIEKILMHANSHVS